MDYKFANAMHQLRNSITNINFDFDLELTPAEVASVEQAMADVLVGRFHESLARERKANGHQPQLNSKPVLSGMADGFAGD